MRYGITKTVLSSNDFIEISRKDYENARAAKQKLAEVLNVEEKLNFVIGNYVEYEQELLRSSLDEMIYAGRDWSYMVNEIHIVNRRLINLLTTCRLYIDQTKHDINLIFEDDASQAENLIHRIRQEYESNIGYRVFEALRNHVQHRSFPIHIMGHSANVIDQKETGKLVKHNVTPRIDVARLKEEGGFKAGVLKELQAMGENVDIKPLLRQYMESFFRIHTYIRNLLAEKVAGWDNVIQDIQNSYRKAHGDDLLGLAVVTLDESDRITETIYIFDDLTKRRKSLMEKNRLVMNLSSHIITNEIQMDDP